MFARRSSEIYQEARTVKRTLLALLAASLLLTTADRAWAQESEFKPILVGCISSYERVIENLKFVGELTSNPVYVERFAVLFGQIAEARSFKLHEIEGVDAQKPWGAAIISSDLEFVTLAFIPTTDFEQLLASLAPLIGEAEAEEELYKVDLGKVLRLFRILPIDLPLPIPEGDEVPVYVKEQDGWAFFAQFPHQLEDLPNPTELLGDLPEKYDLAVELHVQNIPEAFRFLLVDQIAGGGAGEEAEDAAARFRQQASALQGQLLSTAMSEAEKLTVGITMNHETKRVVVDVIAEPVADSDLARHVAELGEATTRFASLRNPDGAVMSFGVSEALHPALAAEMSAGFEAYRAAVAEAFANSDEIKSDEERQIFEELFDEISKSMKPAFDSGRVDMAARVTGSKLPWTLVAALAVEDTSGLESAFERVAELAKDDQYFTHVQLDVEKVGEARVHALTLRGGTPETALLETIFGELNLHVAFAPDSLWLAVGPDALDELKNALGASEESASAVAFSLRGEPLMKGLGAVLAGSNRQIAGFMGLLAPQMRGVDLLELSVEPSDGKLRVHIEIEAGYIKLAAIAAPIMLPQIIAGQSRAAAANAEP